jgi:hypothetical protein
VVTNGKIEIMRIVQVKAVGLVPEDEWFDIKLNA